MVSKNSSIAENWYHLSFDSLYPVIYAHRTVDTARPEALFSIHATPIKPEDAVLDLCCGMGRHMAHLVKHAHRVVGLDYSKDLLGLAHGALRDSAELVRADMRSIPFENRFDVVANYFTSFGYFMGEDENLSVVRGVARALKPGGRFFIDYLNRAWTEQNLEPRTVRHHDEYEIVEERWIDNENHRINKHTRVQKDGRTIHESGESVKLYSQKEITSLLRRGGLTVTEVYGDYAGAFLSSAKPRMIIIGTKDGP